MALTEDEPPMTLPRAHSTRRPPTFSSGSAKVHPIVQPILKDLAPSKWDVNEGIAVPTACFEQQDARFPVRR